MVLARIVTSFTLGMFALTAGPALGQHEHGSETPKRITTPETPATNTNERYYCPMHCEGEKVYPKAGKCPVCKMNLKLQTSDVYTASVREVSAAGNGEFVAGKRASLEVRIKSPTGMLVRNFEPVHEKTLHLLIVSTDLSWFRHEHPVLGPDGTFTLDFTFPAGGTYIVYHDFTPASAPGAGKGPGQQVVRVQVEVKGAPVASVALAPDAAAPKTVDGYTVSLGGAASIKVGDTANLAFTLSKDGSPVTTLAPYLGAFGHLVVISADGKEFVHSHPLGGHEGHAMTSGGPTVAFEAHFKVPGLYKGWGQFNVGTKEKERIITVPFTFNVEAQALSKPATRHEHK